MLLDEPRLLEDVLGPDRRRSVRCGRRRRPSWHGVARADVFFTDDGVAVAELNCDTPTGEAEAVVLGAARGERRHPGTVDPSRALEERFLSMLEYVARRERVPEAGAARTVGLVYPTELTDDLPLVRLYQRWLEERGYGVVLGSPYNLTFEGGRTRLFDAPIDVLLRHYKTDWWGERQSAWLDDAIVDDGAARRAARARCSRGWRRARSPSSTRSAPSSRRTSARSPSCGSRSTASRPEAQAAIERYVPVTRRLEVMHAEQLAAQRGQWVIKSDYGAEGEEVVVGREVDDATWRQVLARARPGRWVAQQYFAAETDAAGANVNYGVFLVAGRASGLYARVQVGATDARAKSAPALVAEDPSG